MKVRPPASVLKFGRGLRQILSAARRTLHKPEQFVRTR